MSTPSRRPASSSTSHTAAASTRGPRTSPPPSTAATLRTPTALRATAAAAQPHPSPGTPLTSQQQQHLSDKVRVNGYLSDRWLWEDGAIDALLADKQLTADSVAELRQQAVEVEGQWLDDWPHTSSQYLDHAAAHRSNHTTAS